MVGQQVQLLIRLDLELKRQLRIRAAERDMSMNRFVVEALKEAAKPKEDA